MNSPTVTEVRDVPRLPPRPADAHKGTYGKVLVIAGSTGMAGAAVLCGTAALRGGAGLVQVAVPEPVLDVVAAGCPCYTTAPLPAVKGQVSCSGLSLATALARRAAVVVAGPGLGAGEDVAGLVEALIGDFSGPLVLDADALNVLDARRRWRLKQRSAPVLFTPHPGELSRLTGLSTDAIQADRRETALAFARDHGGVLVLKGSGTIVTDGQRLYTNTTGNPGMATGGTGDVLAGLLGGLLTQSLPPFEAAVLATYAHGLAGDLARDAKGEVALMATDVLAQLPAALRKQGPGGGGLGKAGGPG
jgi:NAD(P)H-hydrate epimerase